jgi:hypothetical protein
VKKLNLNLFANLNLNYKGISVLLVLIFVLLRLYLIQVPEIKKTDWKEIDYIQISKNYTKKEVQFWEPTISWPAEGPRVTAMEFPLVPFVASKLYQLFGFNVFTLRIIPLICFILLSIYLYKFVILLTNDNGLAFIVLLISLIIPLNYIYSRMLFSDPVLLMFIIISIYNLLKWKINDRQRYFTWSFVFFTLSLLLKPTSMYALLPLLYIYYTKTGNLYPKNYIRFGTAFLLSLIPSIMWYVYAYHLTQVSIDVFGVFGGHNKFQTFTLLTDPNWWKTMLGRFYQLFGGKYMLLIFIIGIFSGIFERKFRLFYVILISNLAFLFILAEGHLDGPYRQFAFIASGSFFTAVGFVAIVSFFEYLYDFISSKSRFLPKINSKILYAGVLFLILARFSYNLVGIIPKNEDYIHHRYFYEIAQKLRNIKKTNSKIITTGNYSPEKGGNALCPILYHYSNLQGWSLESEDLDMKTIEALKSKGADIFVGVYLFTKEATDFNLKVQNQYPIVYKSEDYVICDLTEKQSRKLHSQDK